MYVGVWMLVYFIVTTDMFRPHMWPSAGWQEREYSYLPPDDDRMIDRNISVVAILFIITILNIFLWKNIWRVHQSTQDIFQRRYFISFLYFTQ